MNGIVEQFHLASTATDLTLNDADLFNSQILEVFDNDDFW
jgi:hypothetical protein